MKSHASLPALALLFFAACSSGPRFDAGWSTTLVSLGSSSSPQCTDLTGDGVLDIVMGGSLNEYQKSDSSVLALDGATGKLLWHVAAKDQVVGSATFVDVTGDGVDDVFIGGRSSEFVAINGATGKEIWRYVPLQTTPVARLIRFNFFNTQLVEDQDGDGIKDLLFTCGGNAKAAPRTEKDRHAGVLGVFSAKSGKLLAADTMPDGKETYMSPVIADLAGTGKSLDIIFGTGGETLGGNLFRTDFKSLMANNISGAVKLTSAENRGFIAPVTLADITRDGVLDIVANWFGGKLIALDGTTNKILWELTVPKTESYSTASPGYFNDDDVPDFFTTYNKGSWPDNRGSIQVVIDGKNGHVLRSDSLGCMGYSSAITVDVNGDGFDEVIWSINEFNCNPPLFMGEPDLINDHHTLNLLDVHHGVVQRITDPLPAKNISSTPWIGDLDGDGKLEIVFCVQRNSFKVDQYNGIQVALLKTNISATPVWPAYMGNRGTGVFARKKINP